MPHSPSRSFAIFFALFALFAFFAVESRIFRLTTFAEAPAVKKAEATHKPIAPKAEAQKRTYSHARRG
jgi:hypothetical protein